MINSPSPHADRVLSPSNKKRSPGEPQPHESSRVENVAEALSEMAGDAKDAVCLMFDDLHFPETHSFITDLCRAFNAMDLSESCLDRVKMKTTRGSLVVIVIGSADDILKFRASHV